MNAGTLGCALLLMLVCLGLVYRDVPSAESHDTVRHSSFCPSRHDPEVTRVFNSDKHSIVHSALLPHNSKNVVAEDGNATLIRLLWWVKSQTDNDGEVTYVMTHSDKCTSNWCQIPCAPVSCRVYFRAPTSVLNELQGVVARPPDIPKIPFEERTPRLLVVSYETEQRVLAAEGLSDSAADLHAGPSRLSDVWVPSHMDSHFLRVGSGDKQRNYGALTCASSSAPSAVFLASAVGPHRPHIAREMSRLIPVAMMGRQFEPSRALLTWSVLVFCVTPVVVAALFCTGRTRKTLWIVVAIVFGAIAGMSAQMAHDRSLFHNSFDDAFEMSIGIDHVAAATVGDHLVEVSFMHHYKFALVVEADEIQDGVSPHLYRALISGSVPVYWGAPNVDDYVPRGSIIKASDFPSMTALAEHLKTLHGDSSKYNEYLKWKSKPKIEISDEMASSRSHSMCGICNALHKKLSA